MGSSDTVYTCEVNDAIRVTISSEVIHSFNTLWLALWLLIYSGWFIIYKPLINYIRSHLCLTMVQLVRLPVHVTIVSSLGYWYSAVGL